MNVHAWGHQIFTLGYGGYSMIDNDHNQKYTDSFGGTSGQILGILDEWCGKERGILMITHIPLVAQWCTKNLHLEFGSISVMERTS